MCQVSYGSVRKPPTAVKTIPYSLHPDTARWSGRPYILGVALAPSDDAVRRFGSAGEGSLWPLYRGTRAVTSTGAGRPGGWPR
eukprot:1586385-Prymnesium_polylepis.1